MVWFFSGIAAGMILLFSALMIKKPTHYQSDISCAVYNVAMHILSVVFAFLLLYRVDDVPTPFNVDEAGMAYDALSIVNYHVDRHLYHFPVYFVSYGDGQSALYTYLAAILIKLFGYSILIVRLPAVILSLISAILFSLMIRRSYGNMASVTAMFLFCVLPFSIMHSRWGLDCYLFFPMLIISCAVFYHVVSVSKIGWYLPSGLLYGLTLYTYAISYVTIPLFLSFVLFYLLVIRKIDWKCICAMGIPLFLMSIPLLLLLAVNNGLVNEIRTRFISIPLLPAYRGSEIGLKNIMSNIRIEQGNIFYKLFCNDGYIQNVIPKYGTLYSVSLPIIVYGFILSIKRIAMHFREKVFSLEILMTALFISAFVISLLLYNPNINRANAVFVPVIFFLVLGIFEILKKHTTAFCIMVCFYLISFGLFAHTYFTDFSREVSTHFLVKSIKDLELALDFAEDVSLNDDTLIYVLDDPKNSIYTVLAKRMDPYTYNSTMVKSFDGYIKIVDRYRFRRDAFLPEYVYIFTNPDVIPEDIDTYGFDKKQFGSMRVYYTGN